MTEKTLTDIAAREFAGDDSFLAKDESRQGLVDTALNVSPTNRVRPLDFPHAPDADVAATAVDDALVVRQRLARARS
jgi:hypothetical protein